MVKKWETFWTKSTVLSLVLGQVLSLLLTSTTFTSSQLANQGIYEPLPLSFLNYILLALIYGGVMLYRRQTSELFAKLDNYETLAWVDAMANLIMMKVKAYQYTSVTSVMLLDCWTILCVLLFTWFFLKTKYGFQKLVGVTICVAGLVTFAFSCVHFVDTSGGNNPLKGDICIIVAATLYGVSNVSEELIVKKADRVELMAFFGILGAFYNAILIAVFERNQLKSIYSSFSPGAVLPFIGFSLARFLFYSGVPVLLKISGSTMLNLSLLTSDMWVVLIRIFAYHEKVDWMYFVAFAAVTLGLIWKIKSYRIISPLIRIHFTLYPSLSLTTRNSPSSFIRHRRHHPPLPYLPSVITVLMPAPEWTRRRCLNPKKSPRILSFSLVNGAASTKPNSTATASSVARRSIVCVFLIDSRSMFFYSFYLQRKKTEQIYAGDFSEFGGGSSKSSGDGGHASTRKVE